MSSDAGHESPLRFPRSSRIISSDDFARILREGPRQLRLAQDLVSVSALPTGQGSRVRIGVTVGKHNIARSVDRALVKRVLRESARAVLPRMRNLCAQKACGLDVNLRIRTKLGAFGREIPISEIKQRIHRAAQSCLESLIERYQRYGDVS